jgi:predicted acetyltransferase
MLKNVQPYCKSLGLSEILVCCLDTNEGSRRTILKNGGRFDGTAYRADENKTLERYWITL